MRVLSLVLLLVGLVASTAFVAPTRGAYGGPRAAAVAAPVRPRAMTVEMGKVASFGIFSPAVLAAKFALGEKRLNKIRGKAIALHSRAITEFCVFIGANSMNMREKLIKEAKTNGDKLGFLV
eukprot:CAMPEP_0198419328 /NCGR_PEP_ID=MMETSP1452-20131203/140_1 /TAXON_ID=1181717 /ORGANISM="Synchroma pusillum, Strain CCMP3072" /LENGTH=121 /DNA_ID=CAMNT_0044139453 /DNA_START=29 /DNA_END=394 /DNA_ORIENTATION=+